MKYQTVKRLKRKSLLLYNYYLFSSGSQHLARLSVVIPIIDRNGWKDGVLSSSALWILENPYRTAGLEPDEWRDEDHFFLSQEFHHLDYLVFRGDM